MAAVALIFISTQMALKKCNRPCPSVVFYISFLLSVDLGESKKCLTRENGMHGIGETILIDTVEAKANERYSRQQHMRSRLDYSGVKLKGSMHVNQGRLIVLLYILYGIC